jgi:ankyrin repeat protein/tetratricopeptide (TPR) repeat protein
MKQPMKTTSSAALRPPVPKGQNVNSRGHQPTVAHESEFDPAGVAHFITHSPWVAPTAIHVGLRRGPQIIREVCRHWQHLPLVALLLCALALLPFAGRAATNDLSSALQNGLFEEEANRNLPAAIESYEKVAKQFDQNRALAATAIFRLGEVNRKLGKTNEAAAFYQRILREFSDQETLAKLSQQNLAGMGGGQVTTGTKPRYGAASQADSVAQLVDIQVRIAQEEEQLAVLKKLPESERLRVLPTVSNDAMLNELESQLNLAQQSLIKVSQDYSADHPAYKTAEKLAKDLAGKRADRADSIMQALETQLKVNRAALAKLNSQNLAGLGSEDMRGTDQPSELSPEAQELARTQMIIAQLRGWDLSQLRRLIPTLVPDAVFDRLNEQLRLNENFGESEAVKPEILKERVELMNKLDERSQIIMKQLQIRADDLKAIVAKQPGAMASRGANGSGKATPITTVLDEEETEIRRIQAMIQNSPDLINAPSGENGTPLYQAASKGQLRVAAFLLDHGADVNTRAGISGKIYSDWTPLFVAASRGHRAMVELLAARGADVNATVRVMTGNVGGNLSGGTALHQAVEKGFQAVAEGLLANKAEINVRDTSGQTPLHLAASRGRPGLTVFLLSKGAAVNAIDSGGSTALMCAANGGHSDTLKKLIAAKADINTETTEGRTALSLAASEGHLDCVTALLAAKADPNAGKVNLPLHCAIKSQSAGVVEALLKSGADANRICTVTWQVQLANGVLPTGREVAPLALAMINSPALSFSPQLGVVKLLLANKADANGKNVDGLPLIFSAVNNAEMTKALLDAGAKPNVDDAGDPPRTPLYRTANPKVINLLITAGADTEARLYGMTRLMWAANDRDSACAEALLAGGAKVNAVAPDGSTALHIAVKMGSQEIIALLLAHKADVNARDNQGLTPLDYAEGKHQTALPSAPVPAGSASFSDRLRSIIDNANPGASVTPTASPVAALLRQHGGLADLPKLDRIVVVRPGSLQTTIFTKGTNGWNRFTLVELLAVHYGFLSANPSVQEKSEWADPYSYTLVGSLSFPDLDKVTVVRPGPNGAKAKEITVNLSLLTAASDCSGNIVLEWGDVVRIAEKDHPIDAVWSGLGTNALKMINRCVSREVQLNVGGQVTNLVISPQTKRGARSATGPYGRSEMNPPQAMLRPVLAKSGLLRISSDLTRVKVTRRESGNAKPKVWVVDCSIPNKAPDLWLRDGDVIEVPEK